MKFETIYKRATELFEQGVEGKFYRMVLYFAVENIFDDSDEIDLTEGQLNDLLRCMCGYLDDNCRVSPWSIADALVNVVREYGADKAIADYEAGCKLLEEALERI